MYCANCKTKIVPDPTRSFSMCNEYWFPVDDKFNRKFFRNECSSAYCGVCGALTVSIFSSIHSVNDPDD